MSIVNQILQDKKLLSNLKTYVQYFYFPIHTYHLYFCVLV